MQISRALTSSAAWSDRFSAELKRRGFTPKEAAILKLKPYRAAEAQKKFPLLPKHRNGICIPYFGLDGKPTGFYRFRFYDGVEDPRTRKPLRYVQERNSVNELYLAPFVDWAALAADPERPLLMTEGEIKAAVATKCGFPTIGLGGVWCFGSKKQKRPLLSQFYEFKWEGRKVYIVFDSDAAEKFQVAQAEGALARQLTQLGALPFIVRIPHILVNSKKTGLDEFLQVAGNDKLKLLISSAEPYAEAQDLHDFNQEVVYIESPSTGIIVRLKDMEVMRVQDFLNHVYADRKLIEARTDSQGEVKVVKKSLPKAWLAWPLRAKARQLAYAPGEDRVTSRNELNLWPGWGSKPRKGDIRPFNQLFDHLTTGLRPHEKKWLRQWLAYPLQHPGTKLFTAVVFWGAQTGTGKTMLGETLGRVYGENYCSITERDLHSRFTHWADKKQFILGDEITGGGDRKRNVAEELKSMITQETVTINLKYKPEYKIRDVMNFYFTSNHEDSFFIEDRDRRYFVHALTVGPLSDEFYGTYKAWKDSADGPAALFYHLLHEVDTSDFNPTAAAPVTAAKIQMIADGRSYVESWLAQLKENPQNVLGSTATLWTTKALMLKYESSVSNPTKLGTHTLGKKLRGAGFTQWGWSSPSRQGRVVKRLGDRLWIVPSKPGDVAELQRLVHADIYDEYCRQHPEYRPQNRPSEARKFDGRPPRL